MPRVSKVNVEPKVASPQEVCGIGGWSLQTVYNKMHRNQIESYRDGRSRKIVIASVHRHIAEMAAASKQFVGVELRELHEGRKRKLEERRQLEEQRKHEQQPRRRRGRPKKAESPSPQPAESSPS
jgi:predicted acyl esterase